MTYRDELSLKIPAFLRGELSEVEIKEIETLARDDADFAADIEFQKSLGVCLKAGNRSDSSLEVGWARLSKAIDAEMEQSPAIPIAANDRGPKRFWQYAVACLACVVIGQAAFMTLRTADVANDQYIMAGHSETGVTIQVKLNDEISAKSLTDFLMTYDGVVTSGPDATGKYLVTYADMKSCEAAADSLSDDNEFFETFSACGDI